MIYEENLLRCESLPNSRISKPGGLSSGLPQITLPFLFGYSVKRVPPSLNGQQYFAKWGWRLISPPVDPPSPMAGGNQGIAASPSPMVGGAQGTAAAPAAQDRIFRAVLSFRPADSLSLVRVIWSLILRLRTGISVLPFRR